MEELWEGRGDLSPSSGGTCDSALGSILTTLQLPGSSSFACTLRHECSPELVSQVSSLSSPIA